MAQGPEFLGLTGQAAETAKTIGGAGVGAAALIYLQHPGTLIRAVLLYLISVGLSVVFTPLAVGWTGFGQVEVSASVALMGMGIARGILRAVDRIDFTNWLPGKKGGV